MYGVHAFICVFDDDQYCNQYQFRDYCLASRYIGEQLFDMYF